MQQLHPSSQHILDGKCGQSMGHHDLIPGEKIPRNSDAEFAQYGTLKDPNWNPHPARILSEGENSPPFRPPEPHWLLTEYDDTLIFQRKVR